jgi:hypothetical protein
MKKEEIIKGYVTCMLWSSLDTSGPEQGNDDHLDMNYTISDLSEDARKCVKEDVEHFIQLTQHLFDKSEHEYDDEQIGHNFWLTRNYHGAGFWDGRCPDIGDELTTICHKFFPELHPYVSDSRQVEIN